MSSSTWSCEACTTINSGARSRCEVCDTPRPARRATPSPPPPALPISIPATRAALPQVATVGAVGGKWNCPACTFENPSSATTKCDICGTAKPASISAPQSSTDSTATTVTRPPPPTSSIPTPTPSPASNLDPADVAFLTSMGFRRATAEEALRKCGSRGAALDYLLAHPPQYAAESPLQEDMRSPIVAKIPVGEEPRAKASSLSSSSSPSSANISNRATLPKQTITPTPSSTSSSAAQLPNQAPAVRSEAPSASLAILNEAADEAARKKREQKRLALLEELQMGEIELKEKEKAARLAAIEEQKRKTKEEEDARKRNAFLRQKASEEKRDEDLRVREQKRREVESNEMHSIEDAIERMRNMYELTRFVQFGKLLTKILKNIVEAPGNENFRLLKLQSHGVQEHLVRPLSGLYILKSLGFVERNHANNDENAMRDVDQNNTEAMATAQVLYLPPKKVNLPEIRHALFLLGQSLRSYTTNIASVFNDLTANYPLETLYYIAQELLVILQNVVSAPTERNFCSIDCESESYQTFIQPYPEIIQLIQTFGFEHHTSKIYWICEKPNVVQCEAGIIDLQQEIVKRRELTPIHTATRALIQGNSQSDRFPFLRKFTALIKTALDRIINDPHEQKYHNIRIDKIIIKCGGPIKGSVKFLFNFGFQVKKLDSQESTEGSSNSNSNEVHRSRGIMNGESKRIKQVLATLPYPGYNLELLKHRFNEFSAVLKQSIPDEELF